MIFKNITDTIGKTPLLEIYSDEFDTRILAKLEYFNPGGSVKDRVALSMINNAEKQGLINKDTVIIEPTSGNTGIGLALVCASRGYKLKLTMPESMSVERRKILQAYGAGIVLTLAGEGMKGSIAKAIELSSKIENSFIPQQFENPANPDAHRKTTAIEILEDTEGKVDVFVSAVGTGGTITGISEVLKQNNPRIKIVAVEPEDSAVLSGESAGPHKIQGIGAGFIPEILNTEIIDEVVKVGSEEAILASKNIAKESGVFVGISSGAALHVAFEQAKKDENKGKTIVVILPDGGERYLSTW
jgi:cysteine synthase A